MERLGQLEGEHPGSVFSLLVPATPTGQLLASDAGADERVQALGRAAEARAKLQAAGFTVARVEVGDSSPLLAIEGEMRARPGEYDAIVLSTFPPGLSRWLRLDLRRQAARRFDLPVIPVVAQPRPAAGQLPLGRLRVRDFVQCDVTTARPDQPLREVMRGASGATHGCTVVLDPDRHPVGILTYGDIIRVVLAELAPSAEYLRHLITTAQVARHLSAARSANGDRVSDWMTSPVITIGPDDTLQRAAELFAANGVHQLPVVEEGRIAGLIRRVDLIEPLLETDEELRRRGEAAGQPRGGPV